VRPRLPAPPVLGRIRGVVLGVDDFDDDVDQVDLAGLGPQERARIAARLRQVLGQLEEPRPTRLH